MTYNPYILRLDEADIDKNVDELRQKLLANLASTPGSQSLKPTDTHGMAAAKKIEVARMARALGTRHDYQEGEAFDREKQELNKLKRISEREEREKKRAEDKVRMAEQKAKWELERRERDRSRPLPRDPYPRGPVHPSRVRNMPPPSPPRAAPMSRPKRDRSPVSRSSSPHIRRRLDSRSPSRSISRSRSPRTRTRTRSRSPMRRVSKRSLSPVQRAAPPARRGRHPDSRSPSVRSVSRSRSRSPPGRRSRIRSNTPPLLRREPSPPAREGSMRQRNSYRDPSSQLPPRGASEERSPISVRGRSRSRSVETGSSMSVSTRSGSSGSRHEGRGKGRARD